MAKKNINYVIILWKIISLKLFLMNQQTEKKLVYYIQKSNKMVILIKKKINIIKLKKKTQKIIKQQTIAEKKQKMLK